MTTEQISLRPLRNEDCDLLYQWITDRELFILNTSYHPISEADHYAWMGAMMRKSTNQVLFVIEENKSGKAIGTCQLRNINWRYQNAELQIRIGDRQFHGYGYGTGAVRLLTHFGFADLNLHRIYLHVFSTNERAIKAYSKCGFLKEGLLRQASFIDGHWVDVVVMGLLRGENE